MAKPMDEILENIRNKYRRTCIVCGKEFAAVQSNHKFCSANCREAYYKSKRRQK